MLSKLKNMHDGVLPGALTESMCSLDGTCQWAMCKKQKETLCNAVYIKAYCSEGCTPTLHTDCFLKIIRSAFHDNSVNFACIHNDLFNVARACRGTVFKLLIRRQDVNVARLNMSYILANATRNYDFDRWTSVDHKRRETLPLCESDNEDDSKDVAVSSPSSFSFNRPSHANRKLKFMQQGVKMNKQRFRTLDDGSVVFADEAEKIERLQKKNEKKNKVQSSTMSTASTPSTVSTPSTSTTSITTTKQALLPTPLQSRTQASAFSFNAQLYNRVQSNAKNNPSSSQASDNVPQPMKTPRKPPIRTLLPLAKKKMSDEIVTPPTPVPAPILAPILAPVPAPIYTPTSHVPVSVPVPAPVPVPVPAPAPIYTPTSHVPVSVPVPAPVAAPTYTPASHVPEHHHSFDCDAQPGSRDHTPIAKVPPQTHVCAPFHLSPESTLATRHIPLTTVARFILESGRKINLVSQLIDQVTITRSRVIEIEWLHTIDALPTHSPSTNVLLAYHVPIRTTLYTMGMLFREFGRVHIKFFMTETHHKMAIILYNHVDSAIAAHQKMNQSIFRFTDADCLGEPDWVMDLHFAQTPCVFHMCRVTPASLHAKHYTAVLEGEAAGGAAAPNPAAPRP